jgi:hypothetical protein
MWNTQGSSANEDTKTFVSCNGNKYDVTGLEGLGLVEKLKAVARDNGISKFDIYDSTNTNLSPSDIENGIFTGDLSLVRFNVAAA